ncbi:MAG: CBS domain-containing protein [Bacteroidaceae bacterium]|nr:CBS domain-containing protein [Bacteroidaceae bacterium]
MPEESVNFVELWMVWGIAVAVLVYGAVVFSCLTLLLDNKNILLKRKKQDSYFAPFLQGKRMVKYGLFLPYAVLLISILYLVGYFLCRTILGEWFWLIFLCVLVAVFLTVNLLVRKVQPSFKTIYRLVKPVRPLFVLANRWAGVGKDHDEQAWQDRAKNSILGDAISKNGMLREIVQFGNETVKDIMTSRLDVVDLDVRSSFADVLKVIAENNYSRIPVYSNTRDNVVGILYTKDLLPYIGRTDHFRWTNLLRPHFCVPETKKINNLLHEFQTKKIHIAVVIDEYGGVSGIVTLEDIIEEIVGEINDEFDDDRGPYIQLNASTYIFDAKVSLQNFCKIFDIDESFFDDFTEEGDTLAGILLAIIGDLPRKHQVVRFKQFVFEILNVDERHISKVKVTFTPHQD